MACDSGVNRSRERGEEARVTGEVFECQAGGQKAPTEKAPFSSQASGDMSVLTERMIRRGY